MAENNGQDQAATVIAPEQPAALATVPQKKPEPISYGLAGIAPKTFEDAWRLAKAIASSDLAPKDFKGKPENCLIAMQMGAELGLTAMSSIQNIAVINSRPCLYGDSFLAVIVSHPQYEFHKEYFEGSGDQRRAVFEIKRRGHEIHVVKFGVAEAKTAGLWGKQGPWTNYPDRMMQMRARGFGSRDKFSDALRGMMLAEEVQDIPAGPTIEANAEPEVAIDQNLELRQEIADFYKTKLATDSDGKRYNDARIAVLLGNCRTAADLQTIYDAGKAELAKRNAPVIEEEPIEEMEVIEARVQANITGKEVTIDMGGRKPITVLPGEPIPEKWKEHAQKIEAIYRAESAKRPDPNIATAATEKAVPKQKPPCPACERLKAKCFDCIQKEKDERVQRFKDLLAEWVELTGREPIGPPTVKQFEGMGRVPQEQEIGKAEAYLQGVRAGDAAQETKGTLFER